EDLGVEPVGIRGHDGVAHIVPPARREVGDDVVHQLRVDERTVTRHANDLGGPGFAGSGVEAIEDIVLGAAEGGDANSGRQLAYQQVPVGRGGQYHDPVDRSDPSESQDDVLQERPTADLLE